MKTVEELKNYYETDLRDDLETLENKRKTIAKKVIKMNVFGTILLIVSLPLFKLMGFYTFIIIVGVIGFWIYFVGKTTKGYVSNFKELVIHKIIKFIDENLDYSPEQCISKDLYAGSKIFPRNPDRYNGDDFVYGKIGETDLLFSELHTQYKTQRRNSNGSTTTEWHTIFKGIFFAAKFNKNFKGETFVLPDVAQKMFGNMIGNFFQSMNKIRGELIKMEDPEFEKKFVVYGKDQIEARYILSTSLMKRIMDYKNKTKKNIFLSFIGNRIFVAISYQKNLFEPKLFKTLLHFELIREYYEDLGLAASIVEELNLNTRIWGDVK